MKRVGVVVLMALVLSGCGAARDRANRADEEDTTIDTTIETTTSTEPRDDTTTTTETTGTPATEPTPDASPSSGCGTAAEPGTQTQSLTVDGNPREYVITVPAGYDPDQPAPLAFNFHGLGANGAVQSAYSGFDAAAADRGYVVVSPSGSGSGDRKFWILPGLPGSKDVAFYDALATEVESTRCIDLNRVYATGISNGAAFASGLACEDTHGFAAIASVSGLSPCRNGGAAVPIVAFHGTDDPVYKYEGGKLGGTQAGAGGRLGGTDDTPSVLRAIELPPVEETVAGRAAQNGCSAAPDTTTVGSDVEVETYADCDADLVFYRIVGGGHTWPGASTDVPLGTTTHTIDANQIILDFFDAHSAAG